MADELTVADGGSRAELGGSSALCDRPILTSPY